MIPLGEFRSALAEAAHLKSATVAIVRTKINLAVPRQTGQRRLFLGVLVLSGILAALELHTSWIQAHVLSSVASRMSFHVVREPGIPAAPAIAGPFDVRLGYAQLRLAITNLRTSGFQVVAHARSSWVERVAVKAGLPPIYREKTQAGLRIEDDRGRVLYNAVTPRRVYRDYDSIPQLVVQSLLFAENREILDASTPYRNPTLEWKRLARAVFDFGLHRIYRGHRVTGGSTVATQLEKLRHSEDGRTSSFPEKFRQMFAASLRTYINGPRSLDARKQIVCDFINSLPLAATIDQGETRGVGDGLQDWFGANFDDANRLLAMSDKEAEAAGRFEDRALAYREVLALLLAVKKPSGYLVKDRDALDRRVDSYLDLLAQNGLISQSLRNAALRTKLSFRVPAARTHRAELSERKAADAIRARLLPVVGARDLYDLDGFDLTIRTTLDQPTIEAVSRTLASLNDDRMAMKAGLFGEHLLSPGKTNGVVYSFTLYERSEGANVLRIQTDNSGQPLNFNQGTKLELGSTAKLRTLASYLEIITELHSRLAAKTAQELSATAIDPEDALTAWAVRYLMSAPDRSLEAMLEAAMNRTYPASPYEAFFTGGGVHHFANFDRNDNGRVVTVRDAFDRSVNLVFIRLVRDIVRYFTFQRPESRAVLGSDATSPQRRQYVSRFADMEGQQFLERFYQRYSPQPESALHKLLAGSRLTPARFAAIYRYVRPEDGLAQFQAAAAEYSVTIRPNEIEKYYWQFGPDKFNLNDQGYLARVHPLELWVVSYLSRHPRAGLEAVYAASAQARQESYSWLFRPSRKRAQDLRIRILLEQDAFEEIHRSWARQGFPFGKLVPSFATAIGSSGDNPEALATLAGIIVNGGVRYPSIRIRRLHFAEGTPMEAILEREPVKGERVMPEAAAALLKRELIGVVERGTAQRARRAVVLPGGAVIPVGGKTGTGDNRIEHFGPHGTVLDSKVRNRTAAFVFTIGDRFFGTLMVYASGSDAAGQKFTSSLAVQVFRDLMPMVRPLLLPEPSKDSSRLLSLMIPSRNLERERLREARLLQQKKPAVALAVQDLRPDHAGAPGSIVAFVAHFKTRAEVLAFMGETEPP